MYGTLFKMLTSNIVVIHDGFPQGGATVGTLSPPRKIKT